MFSASEMCAPAERERPRHNRLQLYGGWAYCDSTAGVPREFMGLNMDAKATPALGCPARHRLRSGNRSSSRSSSRFDLVLSSPLAGVQFISDIPSPDYRPLRSPLPPSDLASLDSSPGLSHKATSCCPGYDVESSEHVADTGYFSGDSHHSIMQEAVDVPDDSSDSSGVVQRDVRKAKRG